MKDFLQNNRFWPAPMEGVMRPAVISACNTLRLTPVWITPFFRVSSNVPKARELKKFLEVFQAPNVKVILQIMGTDAGKLAATARLGMEAGAHGIDLNCGCPSNQVVRHGAGAGALRTFEETARIVEAIRKSIPEDFFSIKTRLGFEDVPEAEHILPLWESAGAPDLFTLHYRTAREGYRSIPGRTERLRRAAGYIKHAKVFGNGDVTNISEAETLMQEANLHGVMIGRGFWRDPYCLVRNYEPQRLSEAPDSESARQKLWQILSSQPCEPGRWSRGSAIEMASLILGPDSPEAQELKRAFK